MHRRASPRGCDLPTEIHQPNLTGLSANRECQYSQIGNSASVPGPSCDEHHKNEQVADSCSRLWMPDAERCWGRDTSITSFQDFVRNLSIDVRALRPAGSSHRGARVHAGADMVEVQNEIQCRGAAICAGHPMA